MGNIPIGIIAASLNSIGIAYIVKEIFNIRKSVDPTAIGLCVLLMVSGAAAAVGGFSTVAYGATYVATFCPLEKIQSRTPIFNASCLFRPDGFFLEVQQ